MRDLADVLGAAVDARALALDGLEPVSGLTGLRTRVRRRRAVRHAVEAVAVLPVVAAAAVGGWLLLGGPDPLPPVVTPSPTGTPTDEQAPTPTPTASPTPTQTPEVPYLSTVTVHPLLPPAERLPQGLLAETDADWSLLRYEAGPVTSADQPGVSEEYLLSPDGRLFQLPGHQGSITGWRPGSTRAVAIQASDGPPASVGVLDLETGVWSPVDLTPVLALHGMTDRDLTVYVQLAPDGISLDVTLEPWDAGTSVSLTRLDPATGRATEVFEGPVGADLSFSPDAAHALAEAGGRVAVTDATGGTQLAADLPGCTPTRAYWLSATVWTAACDWAVPEDVDSFYAVHSLDGRVWGAPNDGVHLPNPLTATGDVVWAEAEMGAEATVPEILLRVSPDRGLEPVTLTGPLMVQYAVVGAGRLIATTDAANSDDNYWGLPAPVYAVDLDGAATRLVVPEPDGADARVVILPGAGYNAGLWHLSDGTWSPDGD